VTWVPAFAGMTFVGREVCDPRASLPWRRSPVV
jgi:hypothetical protein